MPQLDEAQAKGEEKPGTGLGATPAPVVSKNRNRKRKRKAKGGRFAACRKKPAVSPAPAEATAEEAVSEGGSIVRSMHAGNVPEGEVLDMLLAMRPQIVALLNTVAEDVHVRDPLVVPPKRDSEHVKALTRAGQGWKTAWSQNFGRMARDATLTNRAQFFRRLQVCLLHCDETNEKPLGDAPYKIYRYVPQEIQAQVTPADFETVKALVSDGKNEWLDAAFASSVFEPHGSLTDVQLDIVGGCYASVMQRYRVPKFNRLGPEGSDTFVLQIHPDQRAFLDYTNQGERLFNEMNAAMHAAWERAEETFTWHLKLTNLQGHGGFTVPVVIRRKLWDKVRRGRDAHISAVNINIGPERVEVRACLRVERSTPDIADFSAAKRRFLSGDDYDALAAVFNTKPVILAIDVGMVNTRAYGVLHRTSEVTAERLRMGTCLDKDGAFQYLSTHSHPCDNVAFTFRECGRDFMDCLADICWEIDGLRSTINKQHNKIKELRPRLQDALGLKRDELIPEDATHPDPHVRHMLECFFRWLKRVKLNKAKRVALYRRAEAVQRCWFGWLTNREVKLALSLNAVVVRENAGYCPIPQDDPKYRGRAFNRMLANGARAKLEKMLTQKLEWHGVPEVMVVSFWTSCTDIINALPCKSQRNGEKFKPKMGGLVQHADEHATICIGNWLLLRPVETAPTPAPG